MAKLYGSDDRVRFFIGDVRDRDRLHRALDGVDYVVDTPRRRRSFRPPSTTRSSASEHNVLGAMNLSTPASTRV